MHTAFLKKFSFVFTVVLISLYCQAQPAPSQRDNDQPKDYLPKEFHTGRREALRQSMPDNSVVAVFAYPVRNFSNDVDYFYHQNPDMYYFSGYKEPHSLLLIFKDYQTDPAGNKYNEILFVQERNAKAEQWTGRRLGDEGAKEKLGFSVAFNGEDFSKLAVNFSKFDKIIFDELPADVAGNKSDKASL
ncbi:MAG: aminopeptidase P N-terminal domain-containing protein, partial [Chitinophagaceae bacterium]